MSVVIRSGVETDATALAELAARTFQETFAADNRPEDMASTRHGGRTLWLGVWEGNARAKAFYLKTGFVDVGSHVFMVGTDRQTDRILVRRLTVATANGAA